MKILEMILSKDETAVLKFIQDPKINFVHQLPSFQDTLYCTSGFFIPVAMLIILLKKLK